MRIVPLLLFCIVVIFGISFIFEFTKKDITTAVTTIQTSFNKDVKSATTSKIFESTVKRVVDGDTIELEDGRKLRYIGINTPETVDPRKSVECFGKEAGIANKQFVEGKRVRIEKDVSTNDKYGRLLGYVYVDNIMVNEYLVQEGFAFAATYPPDVKYQSLFNNAEKKARSEKKGLWGRCY